MTIRSMPSSFKAPCSLWRALAGVSSTCDLTLLVRYRPRCVILEQTFVNDARGLALRLAKGEGRLAWSSWVSTPVWPIRVGGLSRNGAARFAVVPTVVLRPVPEARSRCAFRTLPATLRTSSSATVPTRRPSRASTLAPTFALLSLRHMPAGLRLWRFRSARSRSANTRLCRSSRPQLDHDPHPDHAADALACAICHVNLSRTRALTGGEFYQQRGTGY